MRLSVGFFSHTNCAFSSYTSHSAEGASYLTSSAGSSGCAAPVYARQWASWLCSYVHVQHVLLLHTKLQRSYYLDAQRRFVNEQ